MFEGSQEYNSLAAELNETISTIVSSGSDKTLSAAADDIRRLMDDLVAYIVANKGNLDGGYISGQMIIIKQKIKALKVNVSSFINTWKPPTCNVTCPSNRPTLDENYCNCFCSISCAQELVPNYQNCRCSEYDDWLRFIQNRSATLELLNEVKWDVRNQTRSDEFFKNLSDLWLVSSTIRSELVYTFDDLDLKEESKKIEEFIANYTRIEANWRSYSRSFFGGGAGCGNTCNVDSIQVYDCSCYSSEYTETYFVQWKKFKNIALSIENYFGPINNRTDLIRKIRFKFQDLILYFMNNYPNYVNADIESQLESVIEDIDFLEYDWNYFLSHRDIPPPCAVTPESCTGDSIANLRTCQCDKVVGWGEVKSIKLTLLDLQPQISHLIIDETNREKLMDNYDVISSAIATLQDYVDTSIKYWKIVDINSVETQNVQIIKWYNSLVQQINDIKSGNGEQVDTCSIKCLNNWTVHIDTCACKCSILCPGTQALDFFHCNCAEKNDCKASCEGSEVLDYLNCVCKIHP